MIRAGASLQNDINQNREKWAQSTCRSSMEGRVLVALRIRPMNGREERTEGRKVTSLVDTNTVRIWNPLDEDDVLRQNRPRERQFGFDRVFDEEVSQLEVFERTAKLLVGDALQGVNCTVFAYGATGSGKTHTIHGNENNPGIVSRTLRELFQQAERQGHDFGITASFIEIYNENIRDLFAGSKSDFLELREDPVRGAVIVGIRQVEAKCVDDLLKLIKQGNRLRTTESTSANAVSSRSHAVVQITIRRRFHDSKKKDVISKLSLIDLAGSERAAATQNMGIRMLEGSMINRSLLALGNCINSLSARVTPGFVNYRDSKLTRILKESLGGGQTACKTIMIANISPGAAAFEESWNTLQYAARARNIKVKVDIRITHDIDDDAVTVLSRDNSVAFGVYGAGKQDKTPKRRMSRSLKTPNPYSQGLKAAKGAKEDQDLRNLRTPNPSVYGIKPAKSNKDDQEPASKLVVPAAVQRQTRQIHFKKKLQRLFQGHLEIKRRILDLDEAGAEWQQLLAQELAEIAYCEKFLRETSQEDTAMAVQATIESLRAKAAEVSEKHEKVLKDKALLLAQLEKYVAKVTGIEDELDGKLSLADSELVHLLVGQHNLTLDKMDLVSSAVITASLLKQKDGEVKALVHHLGLLRKASDLQRTILPPIEAQPKEIQEIYSTIKDDPTRSHLCHLLLPPIHGVSRPSHTAAGNLGTAIASEFPFFGGSPMMIPKSR